jgi:hypothetical protein
MPRTGIYVDEKLAAVNWDNEIIPAPAKTVETQSIVPVLSLPDGMEQQGWEFSGPCQFQVIVKREITTVDPRWEEASAGIPIDEPVVWNGTAAKAAAETALTAKMYAVVWDSGAGFSVPINLDVRNAWTQQITMLQAGLTVGAITAQTETTLSFDPIVTPSLTVGTLIGLGLQFAAFVVSKRGEFASIMEDIHSANSQEQVDQILADAFEE